YKFSSRIGTHCRPGAITGRLFQRAPVTTLVCGFGVSRDQSLRIPPAPRSRTPSVVAAEVTRLTLAERNVGQSEPPYVGCYFLNGLPAFTLIELLVVIAVIAILAAI